jgi:hypothetical protein
MGTSFFCSRIEKKINSQKTLGFLSRSEFINLLLAALQREDLSDLYIRCIKDTSRAVTAIERPKSRKETRAMRLQADETIQEYRKSVDVSPSNNSSDLSNLMHDGLAQAFFESAMKPGRPPATAQELVEPDQQESSHAEDHDKKPVAAGRDEEQKKDGGNNIV